MEFIKSQFQNAGEPRPGHGAAPDRFMEHIAMWEGTGDGSPETQWAEPVTDTQYNGSRSRNE